MEKENSILLKAQKLVHGDREESYGHPLEDFSRTAKMWSAILGIDVTPEQVGLCMCCVKISRQVNAPKEDNLIDLAGYAETVHRVINKKAEGEPPKKFFDYIKSGDRPAYLDRNIQCKLRDGRVVEAEAILFDWQITGADGDIIHWRYL